MIVRFSQKGINYLILLTNGGFMSKDELMKFSCTPFMVDNAKTLDFAAQVLSRALSLTLEGMFLEEVPRSIVEKYIEAGWLEDGLA